MPLDGCGSGQMVSVLVAVLCPLCFVLASLVPEMFGLPEFQRSVYHCG
jgi:hypothetical protein